MSTCLELLNELNCSHSMQYYLAHTLNYFFLFIICITGFPVNLVLFCCLSCLCDIDNVSAYCLGCGILSNVAIFVGLLHVYDALNKISGIEIGVISFFICMVTLIFYAQCAFNSAAHNGENVTDDDDTTINIHIEENEELNPNQRLNNVDNDMSFGKPEQLARFEQSLFKWLNVDEKYIPGKTELNSIFFHYISISLVASLSIGYIAQAILQISSDDSVKITFAGVYETAGIVFANILGGYAIVQRIAQWFLKHWKKKMVDE
eukprot:450836_1